MFKDNIAVRNTFQFIALAAILLVLTSTRAAQAQCQSALANSTGAVALTSGNSTGKQKEIDEWSGEVIKIQTTRPGVLSIGAVGNSAQSALYTGAASGPHPLIDTTQLGNGRPQLQAVVPAGLHCIQVIPPTGATGEYEVEATFIDVCHLNDIDDHGDSFLCSTALTLGVSDSGELDSGATSDSDVFSFVLTGSATVSIESTGSTDVEAGLFDGIGDLLSSDDDDGSGSNFLMVEPLAAGTYYVRVQGADGAYGVSVSIVP